MIITLVAILYIVWMKTLLWYILSFFSEKFLFTFIIIKLKTELCFSISNIGSVMTNFAPQKVKNIYWVTVKGSTLNFEYFLTCFCCKNVSSNLWSYNWQVPFSGGTEPPGLSIFGNGALTRLFLRFLQFWNHIIATSGKTIFMLFIGS